MQPELFQRTLDDTPAGDIKAPRLWVRRLVIWEAPDKQPLRDIPLRPGMNIVWTPDDQGIGHGGGKTLFCRLLRYCLGENTFAPEEQRDSIASAFLNAYVGAEVILDGVCWAILRPLGSRRRHFAVPEGQLEELIKGEMSSTGIEPFLNAVENKMITSQVAELVPGRKQQYLAWQVALAWLTRDQECRFDHVLDWRSTQSDSDSPARGLNQTEKLEALRAFLKAMTPQEQSLRQEISKQDEVKGKLERETDHQRWEIQRLRQALLEAFSVTDDELTQGSMGIALLRDAAHSRLAKLSDVPSDQGVTNVHEARDAYESAKNAVIEIEKKAERLGAEIAIIPNLIARIEGEYPSLQLALSETESFPCPICEVPIDRVLADGCGLSHKLPDIDACKQRLQQNRDDYANEKERLTVKRRELNQLKPELELAKQKKDIAEARYRKLDDARHSQENSLYEAKRLIDESERLEHLMHHQQQTSEKLQGVIENIENMRQQVIDLINRQASALSELNEKFDAIINSLIKDDCSGSIRLTGKGLNLTVQMGGNRSTSAIDSLKVVAFDLAALCLAIEGKTNIPAFLIHDSPREADLGLPLYDRLFQLIRDLEDVGGSPLFQYIITTTTRPPTEFQVKPWLAVRLSGSPASERLLRNDL
ncbi:hypothetical protein [Saccharospirillum sp.]|uniref:hypothetical protein n=1 Tax=Saccharospirillum sp. TaxID=2033801 RepID=UPI00349FF56F